MALGGLCVKRGFCQGYVLNFSLSAAKHHEWCTASPAAVLELDESMTGLKAIGFVVHLCACIFVAVRGFETEKDTRCVKKMDFSLGNVEQSHLLSLFFVQLAPSLKL